MATFNKVFSVVLSILTVRSEMWPQDEIPGAKRCDHITTVPTQLRSDDHLHLGHQSLAWLWTVGQVPQHQHTRDSWLCIGLRVC